ncbi:hypothetical protein [Longimicrobium sp.]|jgi:hypothetical protein|uniref:hypothetical protein n=1 Tax=Longimicrobium sp. TaxID=2029185 RepID=UPI002ED91A2F
MQTEPLKHAFWAIVTDCLQAFHDFERDEAVLRVAGYRESIENPPLEQLPPAGYDADLIFHEEPFYLASDLAGEELNSPSTGSSTSELSLLGTDRRKCQHGCWEHCEQRPVA